MPALLGAEGRPLRHPSMNSGQGKLFAGMTLWGQGRNADSSRLRNITYSTEFADLFPEAVRSWPWVPRFTHELLDQTTLEPEVVAGNVKGRITQLLMMAAFNPVTWKRRCS